MLKERYKTEIVPKLMKELNYKNVMQVPRIKKVVLNMGLKDHDNPKIIEASARDMTKIAGQKAVITKAKRAISDFGITQGDAIGCRVTLRGDRAYAFLDKFFNVVLPAIRDFRGLSADSFDGRGNFSVGLTEQLVFPEIKYDEVEKVQGMDVTIVTTAKSDREGYYLLKALGLPFKD
jgi:large subunit ribosomal protein L5